MRIVERKYFWVIVFFFIIILFSLIKADSIFNYSVFDIDEEYTVKFAVGFLGYDFNPRWFGYHTLPMYLLSTVYFIIYGIYSIFNIVSSKVEFVSLLFDDNGVFFISARIVCSLIYTIGCFVLSIIIYKSYRSKIGAIFFFLVANFIPDAIYASNNIRVDTFVFLFLSLTIYFSTYAEKKPANFVLSIIFCAAAFASKIPAIVFYPILFLQTLIDVRSKIYPKKYLIYIIALLPTFTFIFMPFAFLDFNSYRPIIDQLTNRASGEFIHVGKVHFFDLVSRLNALINIIVNQVGVFSIIGMFFSFVYSIIYDRKLILPFLYCILYVASFTTSLTIDHYWLRPIYPFFIFFTIVLLTRKDILNKLSVKFDRYSGSKNVKYKLIAFTTFGIFIFFIIYYSLSLYGNVLLYYKHWPKNEKDTRVEANNWIQQNFSTNDKIWLEGQIPHYLPKVFSNDTITNRIIPLGFYLKQNQNKILDDAFEYYCSQSKTKYKILNVRLIGNHAANPFTVNILERVQKIKPGDYVVISSYIYSRYYKTNTMQQLSRITYDAQKYYAFLRKQELKKSFKGSGPNIDIYQIRDSLSTIMADTLYNHKM
ncbi:MAG: glycosyltransferase family 39 protein [Bacteroidota bacterium]|nr:glycosyltransferase family 39 protein [Bacteroidota bacterium]